MNRVFEAAAAGTLALFFSLTGCGGSTPSCPQDQDTCSESGLRRCSPDGDFVQVCATGEDGCLAWTNQADCAADGLTCTQDGDEFACSCEDECPAEGDSRCAGTVVQKCIKNSNGCLGWQDAIDCAQQHQTCDDASSQAVCTGCTSDCDETGATRCNGDILEVCADQKGCLFWLANQDCSAQGAVCSDASGTAMCTTECSDNPDCGQGQYCAKNRCADLSGNCQDMPQACPDVYEPVCGCDGQTYGNGCYAAASGVNVDQQGYCGGDQGCTGNAGCPAQQFCSMENCTDEFGTCQDVPQTCPEVYQPVCGCDGQTFTNACYAASAGVSVDYEGACSQNTGCTGDADCGSGQFCQKDSCTAVTGACIDRPANCMLAYIPVCGCDGQTYQNECWARHFGVNVDYDGECTAAPSCGDNSECNPQQYCQKQNCSDALGSCMARPDVCPEVLSPVCGCDGQSYTNNCYAAQAGTSVDYAGYCTSR